MAWNKWEEINVLNEYHIVGQSWLAHHASVHELPSNYVLGSRKDVPYVKQSANIDHRGMQ